MASVVILSKGCSTRACVAVVWARHGEVPVNHVQSTAQRHIQNFVPKDMVSLIGKISMSVLCSLECVKMEDVRTQWEVTLVDVIKVLQLMKMVSNV
jgi:hypothetical protein